MANRVTRGEITDKYPVAIDKTAGGRYTAMGPNPQTGAWVAWDHEEGEELGVGTRDEMNALIAEQPDDRLSRWEDHQQ